MQYVKTLIDKAAKICGSDSALAERMGIPRQNVHLMRAGKRAISPETAAELADIAGENAKEAAIEAIIEGAKGTRREGLMREILGKGLAAGVAGMLLFSYGSDATAGSHEKGREEKPYKQFTNRIKNGRGSQRKRRALDRLKEMIKAPWVLPRERGPLPRRFVPA